MVRHQPGRLLAALAGPQHPAGEIISKGQAARYALATFPPRWHPLIDEALRIRQADLAGASPTRALFATALDYLPSRSHPRPGYRTPLRRRRDLLAFGHLVIDDGHRLYQRCHPPGEQREE